MATAILTLALLLRSASPGISGKDDVPYIYRSIDAVPRYLSFVTDDPKFNRMWTKTIESFLSRQLENGELIESTVESGLYPNAFPRNLTAPILVKSGYHEQVRRYLDFMWENQKKDGSFWNFYDMKGTGGGKVEEDGGCYIVSHTYLYALYSGDHGYLKERWGKIRLAMDYLEDLFNEEIQLVYSTAGYSEGNIAGGYNVYHQSVSIQAFRSASRIARILGKEREADRWRGFEEEIREGLFENLYNPEENRFYFQRRPEGGYFDPPYPAFLVLSYYDVVDPTSEALANSYRYLVSGPRYGEYSKEIFGTEPFDHAHATGRGFWFGQNGHGWIIPYLLKAGRMEEADRWMRSLIAATDTRTHLVPEHINWDGWDPDGGEWAGKRYGVLPDSSAWVDAGNLYALSTAMHVVFTIVDSDPADEGQTVTFRVPPSFGVVAVTNLRTHRGYFDATYHRMDRSIEINLMGVGNGELVVVGAGKVESVRKDGNVTDRWEMDDSGNLHIFTDFRPHRFTIQR